MTWSVIAMLAALPDGAISFDHYCYSDETDGTIAAVRWTLNGTHLGNGQFGPPSSRPVTILGMSHFRFRDGKIVQEWTLWDEIAVLMQIHSDRNALVVATEVSRAPRLAVGCRWSIVHSDANGSGTAAGVLMRLRATPLPPEKA